MKSRLILVDDHILFREGLKSLLKEDRNIRIVGEAGNGRDAVRLCRELLPDIVIIDIAMPELSGIEATHRILGENPKMKVIVLSMHSSRRFVTDVLKAGAMGYLLKDCALQELSLAIKAVRENKTYLSPSIAGIVVKRFTNLSNMEIPEPQELTSRESEVLQLLTEGKKVRDVAGGLNISIKTVQTHRRNIMAKLDLHNLADLTKYAIRRGLISNDG